MTELPDLDLKRFSLHLGAALGGGPGDAESAGRLHAHYLELRRWVGRLDLIGPGAHGELFERHYAESLAALPWLPSRPFRLVDIGSGAGFPGFVLAAARPDAESFLVEARQKKAAFLAAAARRAGLVVSCVNARVSALQIDALPEQIDVVTLRALRLAPRDLAALTGRLSREGRLLVWEGAERTELPEGWAPVRRLLLPGSATRYLAEYRPVMKPA